LPKKSQERQKLIAHLFLFLKNNLDEDIFLQTKVKIEQELKNVSFYSYQEIEVLKDVDYGLAMKLILKAEELPGLNVNIRGQRDYPTNDLLSHVLGYLGKISLKELKENPGYSMNDFKGKSGLEIVYEDILKGKDGQKKIEVNSLGKEEKIISQKFPKTGQDLILSIDLNLQEKLKEVLTKYLKNSNSKAGSIIVLNPNNGAILGIFSLPSYNNNLFIKGDSEEYFKDEQKPLFFRAIAGEYPSGSVIKPVIAAAGLAEGLITEKTSILSKGGIQIKEWFFPDWKQGGHGWTNLTKALAESVNTFFYYLGGGYADFKGLGPEKINYYAHLFGLTEPTGIDLLGESKGLVATPKWKEETKKEKWYIGDTYHLSIGQGDILVTPLQVANYTSVFANNGILFKPSLVQAFQNPETGERQILGPKIIRKDFIEKKDLDLIRQGLRAAVESGSAKRLSFLPVEVAGKTGTAQVSNNKNPHAWFTGFAPYKNPEIVITVLIENGGGGDKAAVSAAYEILSFLFETQETKATE